MDLTTLYESILKSLNFTISPEGLLTYCVDDAEIPAVIDNRRLVIPTRDVLRKADWDNLIAFHPLSESVLSKGESIVLRKLKEVINHRLRSIVADMLMQMAQLGLDVGRQKSLSPKSSSVLSTMKDIDQKFIDMLTRLLSQKSGRVDNHVISIYLKNRGNFRGRPVASVAMVFFPLLEQIEENNDTVGGIKLRVKDRTILTKMFEFIFPDASDPDAYSAPTIGQTAPNFDALMRAYVNVASRINEVVDKCKDVFSNPNELRSNLDWFPAFENLSVYEGLIPVLAGNEGERVPLATPAVQAPTTSPQSVAKRQEDKAPWEEPEQEKTNSPFETGSITEILRKSGPFRPANPATSTFQDPNRLNRGQQGSKTEDYASWLARKNAGAGARFQPQPQGYPPQAFPQQPMMGYPMLPQGGPDWLQQGVPPVAPGEYAGRVRGTVVQPVYGMPYGYAQQPMMGYGQPAMAPSNGYPYHGSSGAL